MAFNGRLTGFFYHNYVSMMSFHVSFIIWSCSIAIPFRAENILNRLVPSPNEKARQNDAPLPSPSVRLL